MKSKLYIPCTILLFTIFVINITLINSNNHLILNSNIDLNKFPSMYNYKKLMSYVEDKYLIEEDTEIIYRDTYYENQLLLYSKEVTEKLFDKNTTIDNMLNKYFVREPFRIFGDFENNYTSEHSIYLEKYNNFKWIKSMFLNENITFENINNIELYYSNKEYYVAQVHINTNLLGNIVLQYNIINEKSSGMLKISDILYYKQGYLDECYNNSSNIKRFNLGNKSDISDDRVLGIYDNYKESIVKINVYKDGKIVDSASGFFIRDDIIVTTFDIFNKDIFEKYDYEIINMFDERANYKGLISFSGEYNLAVIKIDRKMGKRIEMNYDVREVNGNNVIVPSVTGNVYVGVLNEMSYKTINSNLLLNSIDKGSLILNSNGDIIGINTRINDNNNLLLSVEKSVISNAYINVENAPNDISAFRLNSTVLETR